MSQNIKLDVGLLSGEDLNQIADDFARYASNQYEWIDTHPFASGSEAKDKIRARGHAARDVTHALRDFAKLKRR